MAEDATVTLEPPATPEQNQEALTTVQRAFEQAIPLKGKKAEATPEPTKPVEQPKPTVEPPKPTPPTPEPEAKPVEQKLPSFVLGEKKEEVKAEPEIKLDDLPKEAPEGSDEKTKINWKKTRGLLEKQDAELKTLREKQSLREEKGKGLSEVDAARLSQLENENSTMKDQFKRIGLQNDPTFITQVIQPLRATYGEAKRIIRDAGGNPEQLDKALMLTGKEHYSAMDEILTELPESAKGELTVAMRDYRRYAQARADAVANAPKVYDELQKQNTVRTKEYFESQKVEMGKKFDERVKYLRDEAHLETLMETQEEGATWWNEIPQKVIKTAKMIALENQDMDVVMDASILAASAISYRDMYQKEREGRINAEKELREIKGAEPRLTDAGSAPLTEKIDVNEPVGKTFLKLLHAQEGR